MLIDGQGIAESSAGASIEMGVGGLGGEGGPLQ